MLFAKKENYSPVNKHAVTNYEKFKTNHSGSMKII